MPERILSLWVKILDMQRLSGNPPLAKTHKLLCTWSKTPRHDEIFPNFQVVRLCTYILFLFLLLPLRLIASELPDLGHSSSTVLNSAQEYDLGLSVMKQLQAASMLAQDSIVTDYLQSLGYRLIATQGQAQSSYQFFAVADKTINAFALPGGFVGVNTGLIIATEAECELAGVLAHEVAHVHQRHIARMFEHMGRLRLSTIAGMIASILIATQNTEAGTGAMAATMAGSQQALINFTREHEKEADFVGIQSLAKAGFDPMGMPAFFHRMSQDTRFNGNQIPEYLLTHPLTESRLVAAQERAKSYPYKQIPDSLQYHLVQARVLFRSFSTPQEASSYFAKKLARGNYRSRLGTLYGYVLALIEERKPLEALPYLEELLATFPDQPLFQLAYAQIEVDTQQPFKALNRLSQALKDHNSNYSLTYAYSELLIKTGQQQKAIQLLKPQVTRKPVRAPLWHLLSAAYTVAHQPVQAHLAEAQYLKLLGDFPNALIQLKLAKKVTGISAQDRRQIEAELKEVQNKINPEPLKTSHKDKYF